MYMRLTDGRVILDGMSGGAAVACLGSSNADIVEVMRAQAEKLPYAYHQAFGNTAGDELAQFLVDRSDGAFTAGAFLGSGSEAVEAIIKIVRQYWLEKGEPARKYVIARFPAYHGNTLGALGVGNVPPRRDIYAPMIPDTYQHVTSPQYKRFAAPGETEEAYSERCAAELEAKIQELGPSNVAAFLAEPISGSSVGCVPPPKGYFPAIKRVLDKHGILLAMDEVMCGTGRSGTLYAWQGVSEGVKPDIVSMAKNLGAGYVTVSGVMVGPRIVDPIRAAGAWKNSHTYQNHPINCAVALAVLRKIEGKGLLDNVNARGEQIQARLKEAFKDDKHVFDVHGRGLFIGVEFEVPSDIKPRFAVRVKDKCFQNGLLALAVVGGTDATCGDAIMLAPAYIITGEQADQLVDIFVKSVRECEADLAKETN
jgi:adenosylmethionine-8-amino-7-oxononanoate aminotransferase